MGDRRSFWGWCLESEEPTDAERADLARKLSERHGVAITPRPVPRAEDAELRAPRITVPDRVASWCSTSTYERAFHAYGAHLTDRARAFNLDFPNPPDVVAHPRNEAELEATLDWCASGGHAAVPYGGGSSVVWGVNPPEGSDASGHHRPRPPRPGPRDRRHVPGGPHPGRRARPPPRGPAAAPRLHAAPLPPVVPLLLARRLDRHPLGRPLRHQPHPHRRVRRVGAHAHPPGLVGVPPPARLRGRPVARPHGASAARASSASITEAWMRIQARPTLPGHGRHHVPHLGGRLRGRPPDRPGQAVAGQLPHPRPGRGRPGGGLDGVAARWSSSASSRPS